MASKRIPNIDWLAPFLIYSGFFFGILFAVAHHIYYFAMEGQAVLDESEQRWVSRIGTGLAFIVKVLLTVSTTTSYIQWFWFRLKRTPTTLSSVDVLYGAIYEPSKFQHIRVWVKSVPLGVIALITWAIPLSTIFTPGAIVVQPRTHTSAQPYMFSQTNYLTSAYTASRGEDGYKWIIDRTGMNEAIQDQTIRDGKVMHVYHHDSSTNISYSTKFFGPSITCNVADPYVSSFVIPAAKELGNEYSRDYQVLAFTPIHGFGPGMNSSFFGNGVVPYGSLRVGPLDLYSVDRSRIYVLVFCDQALNITLLSCDFFNATYSIDFELLNNGQQNIHVKTEDHEPLLLQKFRYTMDIPLGNLTNEEMIKRTYLGLAVSFGYDAIGGYSWPRHANLRNSSNFRPSGSIGLLKNERSGYENHWAPSKFGPQAFIPEAAKTIWEDTFRNITVSTKYALLPSNFAFYRSEWFDTYLYNGTTNATVSFVQNDYVYSRLNLILPYGFSVLATLACSCMGTWAMVKSGGSFSHDFSTVFRFLNIIEGVEIGSDERGGANPLPKEWRNVVLKRRSIDQKKTRS